MASASADTGTDIDLAVAWYAGALRLTIGDHGSALPGHPKACSLDLQGRGLAVVVAGLSRTFGVLSAADGGTLVWAVRKAPAPFDQQRKGHAKGEPVKNAHIIKVPRHDLGNSSR